MKKQIILTLDMEGVLVDEIWINVAIKTGIEKLKLTTKDIDDYDKLMKMRIELLDQNNLNLNDIQEVISTMDPFPGAVDFLDWAREKMQVIVLTDSFIEFARPLIKKMKYPTTFCHNLDVNDDSKIINYNIRIQDQKKKAVESFRSMNFNVISSGDSFNDTGMMLAANYGIFFKPSPKTLEQFPQFPVANNYEELKGMISGIIS